MKNKSNQTTQALMNNPANLMPVKVSEIQRYRDQCDDPAWRIDSRA